VYHQRFAALPDKKSQKNLLEQQMRIRLKGNPVKMYYIFILIIDISFIYRP